VINNSTVTISEDAPVFAVIDSLSTPGYNPTDLYFSIIEGNESGLFSVTDYGKIILESQLDYEITNFHRLKVIAAISDMQDTAIVEIHVENVVELGLPNDKINQDFRIYPNPVVEELNIDISPNAEIDIHIFGMDGKSFHVNKTSRVDDCIRLDVHDLNPGIYLLVLNNNFKMYSFRFYKI